MTVAGSATVQCAAGASALPDLEAALRAAIAEARAGDGAHPGSNGYAAMAALVDGWAAWREWLA